MQGDVRPDHVILLDAPVETGMARARKRGALDRFEQETVAFFERVRHCYRERAALAPERYNIIDAGRPLDVVSAEVSALVRGFVGAG